MKDTGYYTRSARVKKAEKMKLAGANRQTIADELGVKPDTVTIYLRGAFKPPVTDEMLIEMFRIYDDVGNWSEVARRLGTVRQVINYWKKVAKTRGITPQKYKNKLFSFF